MWDQSGAYLLICRRRLKWSQLGPFTYGMNGDHMFKRNQILLTTFKIFGPNWDHYGVYLLIKYLTGLYTKKTKPIFIIWSWNL